MKHNNVLPFRGRQKPKKESLFMIRGVSTFLGVVLLAMFVISISGPSHAFWLIWLDLAASVCAFIIAGIATPTATRTVKMSAPIALSIGLFVLWIIAMASPGAPTWLTWFNFGVACAFLLTGLAGGSERIEKSLGDPMHFRRSA